MLVTKLPKLPILGNQVTKVHVLEGGSMKKKIAVYVDAEVLEDFKKALLEKYGRVWQVMGDEISNLMREWLQRNGGNAHTQIAHVKKTEKVWRDVKNYLTQCYNYSFFSGQKIPRKHIIMAISETRGCDERTIRKWIKRFIEKGVLRWNGGEVFEIV